MGRPEAAHKTLRDGGQGFVAKEDGDRQLDRSRRRLAIRSANDATSDLFLRLHLQDMDVSAGALRIISRVGLR
jgi:hypothetical protein